VPFASEVRFRGGRNVSRTSEAGTGVAVGRSCLAHWIAFIRCQTRAIEYRVGKSRGGIHVRVVLAISIAAVALVMVAFGLRGAFDSNLSAHADTVYQAATFR
jgi:hypothetical protein